MIDEISGAANIASVINTIIISRKLDKWARLLISCFMSGWCTFCAVMGSGIIAHVSASQPPTISMLLGFAEGLVASSAVIFNIWRRSELTKGIQLSVPRSVEAAETQILQSEGMITIERK